VIIYEEISVAGLDYQLDGSQLKIAVKYNCLKYFVNSELNVKAGYV
jgi:hypothetical protein